MKQDETKVTILKEHY